MSHALSKSEFCPIHRSKTCCGREGAREQKQSGREARGWVSIGRGTWRLPDGRVYRTPASLREVKKQLLRAGDTCIYCDQPFTDFRLVDLAHKKSKGNGGFKRDDSLDNLGLSCRSCNHENGSRSL